MNLISRVLIAGAALAVLGIPAVWADGPDRQPVCIRQIEPVYPFEFRLSGNKGKVVVDFIVDPEGNVVRALVAESTHPDFEAPAVEAVLQWKFRPALKNGRAVFVHMQVPILFQLEIRSLNGHFDSGPLGVDVWKVPPHAPKGTPPDFDYDQAPRPILTSAPVYPFELLARGTRGSAKVAFAVDPKGYPHILRLEAASAPEFGASACAMIMAWTFAPAMRKGKPCWAYLGKEVRFTRNDHEFPLSDSAIRLLNDLGKSPCPILADSRKLDIPLVGRFQPAPVIPDSILKARGSAHAVVDFIVDHAGHAQLPRVVSTSDPDFGWAAATAVARWQFSPPLSKSKQVDVRARIPLVYSPPPSASGGETGQATVPTPSP